MRLGILVRLRPTGPWRIGPDSGARDRVETIYHSDSMYSAVTAAMARLGRLEEWLAATAANPEGSEVRFSSCYPFQRKTMFVVPPQSVWPPPASAKIRYKGARFVPLQLVASLLADQPVDEGRWLLDGASECLLPSDRNEGPFRATLRSSASVDRVTHAAVDVHTTACLEFSPGCGLWFLVGFASREARERWAGPVKTALRLLADTGFGGERSQGWGRSEAPEFVDGDLPGFVLPPRKPKPPRASVVAAPEVAEIDIASVDSPIEPPADTVTGNAIDNPEPNRDGDGAAPDETETPEQIAEPLVDTRGSEPPAATESAEEESTSDEPAEDETVPAQQAWWMLSLFTPNAADQVDWTRGKYALLVRSGRIEGPARHGDLKTPANMVQEGSVLVSDTEPRGGARDVAPASFPHPVWRAGFALAIPIPLRVTP
jgi:CRISPR type III-A-associated RAMP protein Csm4